MSRPGLHRGDGPLAEIAFWGLLFLIAWAPLPLASNRPWSMNFLVLIAALLLFTWACAVLQRPSLFNVPISRILVPGIPFLCVLIWSLIQTTSFTPAAWHNPIWQETAAALGRPVRGAISIDPAASINATLRLFSYGAVFLIAAQFGRRTSRARILIWCVAIVTIAYSAYGVAIFYSGNRTILWFEKWAYLDDLTSTFVARASFGAYAGIGMLTVLALAFDAGTGASERRDRSLGGLLEALPPSFYLLVISVLLLAVTVLLTNSRGAVVVTALGVAVMMVMLIARYRERRRLLLAVSVAMVIAGFAVLEISGGGTLGRTLALAEEGTGRDSIHALTDKAISDAPLLGWGLDSFKSVYFLYRDFFIPWPSPRFDKAHNTYLELILELGYVAFAVLMVSIAAITLRVLSGVAVRNRNVVFPVLGVAVTVLIGTHALLDFSIQMPAVAVTYAAIMGVAYAQSWNTEQWERNARIAEERARGDGRETVQRGGRRR